MRFNFYTALGIPAFTQDQRAIKTAYRKQMKFYHPDNGNVDPALAQDHSQVLNRIYGILSDPVRKADYDNYLYATADDPL